MDISNLYVSIPLEQGSVFRQYPSVFAFPRALCLNPFGTGQCLSTKANITTANNVQESQSLWNRAVSFDIPEGESLDLFPASQSLWNRAVSFDNVQS